MPVRRTPSDRAGRAACTPSPEPALRFCVSEVRTELLQGEALIIVPLVEEFPQRRATWPAGLDSHAMTPSQNPEANEECYASLIMLDDLTSPDWGQIRPARLSTDRPDWAEDSADNPSLAFQKAEK